MHGFTPLLAHVSNEVGRGDAVATYTIFLSNFICTVYVTTTQNISGCRLRDHRPRANYGVCLEVYRLAFGGEKCWWRFYVYERLWSLDLWAMQWAGMKRLLVLLMCPGSQELVPPVLWVFYSNQSCRGEFWESFCLPSLPAWQRLEEYRWRPRIRASQRVTYAYRYFSTSLIPISFLANHWFLGCLVIIHRMQPLICSFLLTTPFHRTTGRSWVCMMLLWPLCSVGIGSGCILIGGGGKRQYCLPWVLPH